MTRPDDGLFSALIRRGVSRRAFLRFCAAMTATLALPTSYVPRVAAAVRTAPRIPVIWLRGQACGGDSEALMLASQPTVARLLLDTVSIEYIDTLMAPSGNRASRSLLETMEEYPNGYFAIVEGAVPAGMNGLYCTTGSRPFADLARDVCDGALATFAVGSCAVDGGLAGAAGGTTDARGMGSIVASDRLLNLPGCPVNPDNLTAAIVNYLTFKELPPRDSRGRPLFAYGAVVHNQCERRAHFEFGEFVLEWGDEAAQKGWCLYKMGCKGPETYANCPTVRYAQGTSWPVKAGHGCIGCTMPGFWDSMSPFYQRLPSPLPFAPDVTADQVGQAAVGGVAALTVAHGAATYGRSRWRAFRGRAAARRARSVTGATPTADEVALGDVVVPAIAAPPEPAGPVSDAAAAEELRGPRSTPQRRGRTRPQPESAAGGVEGPLARGTAGPKRRASSRPQSQSQSVPDAGPPSAADESEDVAVAHATVAGEIQAPPDLAAPVPSAAPPPVESAVQRRPEEPA